MKKYILFLLTVFSLGLFYSCSNDEDIDEGKSIFDTNEDESKYTDLDKWIIENITRPYNIKVLYKYSDIEAGVDYTLTPATIEKSSQMVRVVKYLWLDVYDEVGGIQMTKVAAPKVLQLIGSGAHSSDDITILGTAEGGMKVTLFSVNKMVLDGASLNSSYFKTIHHEFAHILDQLKPKDEGFEAISQSNYTYGDWSKKNETTALQQGFISKYAGHSAGEDFAEILSIYVTRGRVYWDSRVSSAGTTGGPILTQKFGIVKEYMQVSWGIDIDELHDVIQRRSNEIQYLTF